MIKLNDITFQSLNDRILSSLNVQSDSIQDKLQYLLDIL